jgi:hypothetical protein
MRPTSPYEDIGGLSEVADLVGRTKQTVRNWITRGNLDTPEPLIMLAATPVWDLAKWRQWAKGHAHLVDWNKCCYELHQWGKTHPHRVKGD